MTIPFDIELVSAVVELISEPPRKRTHSEVPSQITMVRWDDVERVRDILLSRGIDWRTLNTEKRRRVAAIRTERYGDSA